MIACWDLDIHVGHILNPPLYISAIYEAGLNSLKNKIIILARCVSSISGIIQTAVVCHKHMLSTVICNTYNLKLILRLILFYICKSKMLYHVAIEQCVAILRCQSAVLLY